MGVAGVPDSRSASASSWEANEDGVLLRDDEGQASEGSKFRLKSGRVLDTRTRSRSNSSAARRSTFLYLEEREEKRRRKEVKNRDRELESKLVSMHLSSLFTDLLEFTNYKPAVDLKITFLCVSSSHYKPSSILYSTLLIVIKAFKAFIPKKKSCSQEFHHPALLSPPVKPNVQPSPAVRICNQRE